MVLASMPADRGHQLRAVAGDVLLQALEILGKGLEVLNVVKPFLDDHMHDGVEQRHVARRLELQHVAGVFAHRLAARINDDELGAAFCRLLEEGRGDGMVFGRIGADDHDNVGVLDLVEGRGHGAGADALDQCRDRRGMTQPRAVIDIVVAKAGADQLLEQIGLFVGAFRRAEAGDGLVAVLSRRPWQVPWRQHREPRPSSPRGNGCRGWRDRHRAAWAGRAS